MKKSKSSRRQHDAPTIADVALEAGVSLMTVSRVINREDSVRPSTRERVEQAIAKLKYVPNSSARQLAGAQPMHIGMIYDNPASTYLSEFLIGALEESSRLHAQLSVEQAVGSVDPIATVKRLIERRVDGLLLPPPLSDSAELLDYLDAQQLPTVVAASSRVKTHVSAVSIDDEQAAFEMTQHLIGFGHRRIGFIAGNPLQLASELRLVGYRRALAAAGLSFNQELVAGGLFDYRSGVSAAGKLLSLRNPPTAIFASNDEMAAATVAVAHRRGLHVPQQLTVCGFDDSLLATSIWPELTTVHQPIIDMSRTAIKMLVEKIRNRRQGQPDPSQHLVLAFALVRRESDAALPTDDE